MYRLGLVGFGNWGSKYLLAAEETSQAKITIICRRDLSRFPPYIRESYLTTDSFQSVLDQKPDGVIIASGPDTHLEYASQCIERRIPFLIEKPLALREEDCLSILRKAQDARFWFHINHVHLFDPAYLKFREIVRSWQSSRLTISSRGENRGPYRTYSPYQDYSPHDISMILGLLDPHQRRSITDFNVERHQMSVVSSMFRITMGSPYFVSNSWVGNGADSRQRSLLAINYDSGDYACYFADQSAQRPVVHLNGAPQDFHLDSPLVCSIRAFCMMISGEIDWRFHFDFYEQIYHMVSAVT